MRESRRHAIDVNCSFLQFILVETAALSFFCLFPLDFLTLVLRAVDVHLLAELCERKKVAQLYLLVSPNWTPAIAAALVLQHFEWKSFKANQFSQWAIFYFQLVFVGVCIWKMLNCFKLTEVCEAEFVTSIHRRRPEHLYRFRFRCAFFLHLCDFEFDVYGAFIQIDRLEAQSTR